VRRRGSSVNRASQIYLCLQRDAADWILECMCVCVVCVCVCGVCVCGVCVCGVCVCGVWCVCVCFVCVCGVCVYGVCLMCYVETSKFKAT